MLGRKDRKTSAVDRLRGVGIFSSCTDEELSDIDQLMAEVRLPAGTKITKEGDVGREFVIILEGEATVAKDGAVVATVGPGAFVGEIALLEKTTRSATVTAVTDVRAFVLNSGEFHALLETSPTLREKIEKAAAEHRG